MVCLRSLAERAMVADVLYAKIPIPDAVLAQHVTFFKSGAIAAGYGAVMSAADSIDVTIWGRGGHGSMPQVCVDPIVIAGYVLRQALRQVN